MFSGLARFLRPAAFARQVITPSQIYSAPGGSMRTFQGIGAHQALSVVALFRGEIAASLHPRDA
jgi:hypothetical protein